MISPFLHQPYVEWHANKEKLERYLEVDDYLCYQSEYDHPIVNEVDDLSAAGTISSYDSSSYFQPGSQTVATGNASTFSFENQSLQTYDYVRTESSDGKKTRQRTKERSEVVIPQIKKLPGPDPSTYKYKPPPEYVPPPKNIIAKLYRTYVSDPWAEWKKRNAEQRRHPVLKYFEQRVIQYEAKRLAGIMDDYLEHERTVKLAAIRLAKARKGLNKTKFIQESISKQAIEQVDERNRQFERAEFNAFYLQKWAAEAHEKKECREEEERVALEKRNKEAKMKAELDAINERREYEHNFIEDDIAETQKIQRILRQTGIIAGVNPAATLPSNLHARDMPHPNLSLKSTSSSSIVKTKSNDKPKSGWDSHGGLLSSLGIKKAPAPISRKAKYLVINLKNSVDFTVNPKSKGRMPWHNAGSGSTMTVFDIDLSDYRDVTSVRCEYIGERGALCLAAEFIRGACPALEILNLNKCEIQTRGLGRLLVSIRLSRLDNIHTMKLRSNSISARGVEFFKTAMEKGALSNLTVLDLRDNELDVEGAYAVVTFLISGVAKVLRTLRLEHNNLGNEGFSHIVNTMRSVHDSTCPELIGLHLSDNNVSVDIKTEFSPYPQFIVC